MQRHTVLRFIVMIVVGSAAAVLTGALGEWQFAPTVGWAVAAAIYSAWVWIAVSRFDGDKTATHARLEEPARGVADLLIVILSVASLGALAIVLVAASSATGLMEGLLAALAVSSVALSWTLLHTLYALRYARLYYRDTEGGIDFNQDERPRYTDFAYLSFTLGMTYQVSDTDIKDHGIRSTVLRHTLLSFLFGAVILATTINLIAGLGS